MIRIKPGKIIILICLAFAALSMQPQTSFADEKPIIITPEKAYSEWRGIKKEQHNVWTRSTPEKGDFETTSEYENRIKPYKEDKKRDSEKIAQKLDAFAGHLYDLRIGKVKLVSSNYDADAQMWDFINIHVSGELYPFRSEFKDKFKFTTYGLVNGSTYPSASRGRTLRIDQGSGYCDIIFEGHPMGRTDAKAFYDVLKKGNASFSILCTLNRNFHILPKQYRLIHEGHPFFFWDTAIVFTGKDSITAENIQ